MSEQMRMDVKQMVHRIDTETLSLSLLPSFPPSLYLSFCECMCSLVENRENRITVCDVAHSHALMSHNLVNIEQKTRAAFLFYFHFIDIASVIRVWVRWYAWVLFSQLIVEQHSLKVIQINLVWNEPLFKK